MATEQIDTYKKEIYERDTISGDFNGDGIIDYAYLTVYIYSKSEYDYYVNSHITFSDATISPIEAEECLFTNLINEGDLNNDGADEIGFVKGSMISNFGVYNVYSFRKNQWHKLISVDYHDSFDDNLVKIHPTKQGYLLAKTIEWDKETEWFKQVERSIKIK